jgi:protein-S-isoprenylcysteine O-methyltransferase Ste14
VKATAWEFKYRLWISFAIILVGFWAPWLDWFRWGSRTALTWGSLVSALGPLGISPILGFVLINALSIAAATAAAALRVSGTAYLGATTVFNSEMKPGSEQSSGKVLADGPYRYLRNPLYAGRYLTVMALTILMPPSGAVVSLLLLAFFMLRLIFGEEAFLALQLGEPYAEYRKAVPRIVPSLRPRVPAGGEKPAWGRALLGEIFPMGVALSFAALSWQYNPDLLDKAVLMSIGLSLVVRGLIAPKSPASTPAA